jgi:uncharacterized surface protein with fasciclin (FAS1) repeats
MLLWNSTPEHYGIFNLKSTLMKANPFGLSLLFATALAFSLSSCETKKETTDAVAETPTGGGQSTVKDDESQKDVVRIAVGSPDHTTLVTALKAATYVDVLANAGPFTVFAPTNAAFDKLPAGTVEGLLKPESKDALRNILEYHVSVGVYKLENLTNGQKINQVNLDNVEIGVKDGKYTVNGANIVATVPASNGVVYVIDAVLLPPAKK